VSEKISMVRRLRLEANGLGEFQTYASRDYRRMLLDAADEIERLTTDRDNARQEVCFLLSRNVTHGCDGDTPEFHATARGWCYLLEEDEQ
jgi:hypothetical protein